MFGIINIRIWWRLKRNPAWKSFCDTWEEIGMAAVFREAGKSKLSPEISSCMTSTPIFSNISEIDINNLTPMLHHNCWVVADSRKWSGYLRKGSLLDDGAIFSEDNATKKAEELNKAIHIQICGDIQPYDIIRGPFYAYRLHTARGMGLL